MVLDLGRENFVFEDTRYFGRLTLETGAVEKLGPEPLDGEFNASVLRANLSRSRQPIKVKLLDQTVVAGSVTSTPVKRSSGPEFPRAPGPAPCANRASTDSAPRSVRCLRRPLPRAAPFP